MTEVTKPLFGVDIDGVIYDFIGAACSVLRQMGHTVHYEDVTHWHALNELVGDRAMDRLWSTKALRRELFRGGPAHLDAVKAVRRLEQVVDLCFITHRPLDCADVTMAWLAEQKLHPRALHFASGMDKGAVAACIGYVDDRTDNAHQIATAPHAPKVFVPARPWNTDVDLELAELFTDWKVVETWVRQATS